MLENMWAGMVIGESPIKFTKVYFTEEFHFYYQTYTLLDMKEANAMRKY